MPTGKKPQQTKPAETEAPAPAAAEESKQQPEELVEAAAAVGRGQAIDAETFLKGIEVLAERLAGQQGREIQVRSDAVLSGSADDLVRELSGTVVVPEPEQPLPEWVVFRSKGVPYTVVRKPRHRIQSPNGEQVFTTGIQYVFGDGEYRTRDQSVVDYLKTRPGFNLDFWQVGSEPDRPPSPELVMARILKATVELDDQALQSMHVEEMAGHKRDLVLNAINEARRQVQRVPAAEAPA